MIIVDVYVPSLSKTYNFRLNEAAPVEDIAEEIAEVVCQYEHRTLLGAPQDLALCKYSRHKLFAAGSSLSDNGVENGDLIALI